MIFLFILILVVILSKIMNREEFLKTVIRGSYGDLKAFKQLLCENLHIALEPSVLLPRVIVSQRIDVLEYTLTVVPPPQCDDIILAIETGNMEVIDYVCKNVDDGINLVYALVEERTIKFAKVLLDHGANPNCLYGLPMLSAVQHGDFEMLKLLFFYGGILTSDLFDLAIENGDYKIAYWLSLYGLNGYETPGFIAYKAQQAAIRDAAQRKIYFWILPKLYRNKEFVMRQASKSYNDLFDSQVQVL